MTITNHLRSALRGVLANKLRAVLTTLGVVIGVASVVAMLALGNGAQAAVEASFRFLGSDTIQIAVQKRLKNEEFVDVGKILSYQDGLALSTAASLIARVDMSVAGTGKLRVGRNTLELGISGVTAGALTVLGSRSQVQPVNWPAGTAVTTDAFIADGRFFSPAEGGGGNLQMLQTSGGGPGGGQRVQLKGPKIIPAVGLPAGEPEAAGLYQRREDQSVFVSTGEINMTVMIPQEGAEPIVDAKSNGPIVEVVVNRNTLIYKDTTEISMEARRDGLEVQQVVELVDSLDVMLEEISTTDTLSVWGQKTGDRIIASVIVYRPFEVPSER